MTRLRVDNYDQRSGICDLTDKETGRRFRAPCEPTGRTIEDEKNQTVEVQR